MNIDSKFHKVDIFISNDNEKFDRVSASTIEDFSFQYFKIEFLPLKDIQEIVKIRELSFQMKMEKYIVHSQTYEKIEIFSKYICNTPVQFQSSKNQDYTVTIATNVIPIKFIENPFINQKTIDFDSD